ncbi:hypothetical protein Aspvir_007956 [Aspergillus viridinutans]|uniref:Uncharacterized protein n=1 Tax=Aspergillus viridinutans TaxID=75553 RepID=A0A9P3F7B1_ASPVI|nr:uncharacterized protein Aspvir_007956 [Aspergillus viridinutans]GIK03881.1 hypothetical protein Aspvir_007956 [Aspergillus viridinutans]
MEDHSTPDDGLPAQVALAQMLFDVHQAQTAQLLGVKDRQVKQAGEEFDDATWMDFRARSRELRDAVLARADARVCTLHADGETAIRDNLLTKRLPNDQDTRIRA